jgi:hypothetical protein
MRKVPGLLRDKLVAEVVDSLIAKAEPQFTAIVNQLEEAQRYAKAKASRLQEIERFAQLITDKLIEEHSHAIIRRAYEKEERIRTLVRECALHWKNRSAETVKARAERERQRKANATLLKTMGLSRSVANYDRPALNGNASVASWASKATTLQPPVDEMDVILELDQTQQTQGKLWKTSSFLNTTATYVSSIVRPNDEDPEPVWETVLLTAEHAGSGAPRQPRSWLVDKFLPKDGTAFCHRHVTYKCSVEDVHDDIPGSSSTGLVVFEAPLTTINTSERVLNAEDAADRLEAISGRFQQGSRYRPALLLLTWEDELLEELVDRLEIADLLSQFERIEVLSLEDAEDLDARFARVLRQLVPSDPRLTQVVVELRGELKANR